MTDWGGGGRGEAEEGRRGEAGAEGELPTETERAHSRAISEHGGDSSGKELSRRSSGVVLNAQSIHWQRLEHIKIMRC